MSDEESGKLFKPSSWLVQIDFINHLVLLNNILVAVLSESQGGKSSFTALLQNNLHKTVQSLVFSANVWFFSTDLLAKLCIACQIEPDGDTTIASIIKQVNEQKKHFLLIIDDAHYLPLSFLEDMLAEIVSYSDGNFFHCCLVANSSLNPHLSMLDKERFENLIHTIPLASLTENETKTWVLKKKPAVKGSVNALFADFYQLTQGNIASINQHINNLYQSKPNALLTITKGCVAGVCLLMASFWCWQHTDALMNGSRWLAQLTQQSIASQPLTSQIPSLHVASLSRSMQPSMFHFASDDKVEGVDHLAVIDKVIMAPKAMYRHDPEKPVNLLSSLVPVGTLLPKSTPVPVNKKHFTIQLLASKHKKQIDSFIASHHLPVPTTIQLLKRDASLWYVLTTGDFARHNEAERAIKSLPFELTKLNPWVRSAAQLSALKR